MGWACLMLILIYRLRWLIEYLGGRGSTNPEERGLTDIEKALVEDFQPYHFGGVV